MGAPVPAGAPLSLSLSPWPPRAAPDPPPREGALAIPFTAQPTSMLQGASHRSNDRGAHPGPGASLRALTSVLIPIGKSQANIGKHFTAVHPVTPVAPTGRARPSPREGALAMLFTAQPTSMLRGAARCGEEAGAHPGPGASLCAVRCPVQPSRPWPPTGRARPSPWEGASAMSFTDHTSWML